MQLNYFAPVRLILGFLPCMRARRDGQNAALKGAPSAGAAATALVSRLLRGLYV
jgi:hypothetical protein